MTGAVNIGTILTQEHTRYIADFHYRMLLVKDPLSNTRTQILFLTFYGIITYMCSANFNKFVKYVRWLCETIFTHQFGTSEDRMNLSSKLMGIPLKTIKAFFDMDVNMCSLVYSITLGPIEQINHVYNFTKPIAPGSIIHRFGQTNSGSIRTDQHDKFFEKKVIGAEMKYYARILPKYLFEAETYIRNEIKKLGLYCETLDKKDYFATQNEFHCNSVKLFYKISGESYGINDEAISAFEKKIISLDDHIKHLNNEIRELKSEYKLDLAEKNYKIIEKDNIINQLQKNFEHKIMEKELKYKLEREQTDNIINQLRKDLENKIMQKDNIIEQLHKDLEYKIMQKDKIIDQLHKDLEHNITVNNLFVKNKDSEHKIEQDQSNNTIFKLKLMLSKYDEKYKIDIEV